MSLPGLLETQGLSGRKEISPRGKGKSRKEYCGVKSQASWLGWEGRLGRNLSSRNVLGKF